MPSLFTLSPVRIALALMLGSTLLEGAMDIGIKVDGDFSDWRDEGNILHDPAGDSRTDGGTDFLTLGASVSVDGLTIYIRTAEPVVIGDSNLKIYIDIDGNPDTGLAFNGLGSDLLLDFSIPLEDLRFFPAQAVFYPEGNALPAGEVIADLLPNGLNSPQTHPASEEFEILIPPASLRGLVPGGRLGILLRDRVGDFAPGLGETFHIDVPTAIRAEHALTDIGKLDPGDIRVASWNVLRNGPLDAGKEAAFGRQLAATKPDIIHFQELYDPSASWAMDFVERWLPLADGSWHARKNNDCITVSRFEIKDSWSLDGNLLVHIDTRAVWGRDALFFNAHTPAHEENQARRIQETTRFMLFLDRLKSGAEPSSLGDDFLLFVVGDLNANSPKIELSSPRTGNFVASVYQDRNYWPDTYNLPLVDAAPRRTHTALPRLFTWRSLTSGNTQRLDYIYYQQSRLTKKKAFVLDTLSMPAAFLDAHNLERTDTNASDHLLLIADFAPRTVDFAWLAEDPPVPGWIRSQWLGPLFRLSQTWNYSPLHGFLFPVIGDRGFWIWDRHLGWWLTCPDLYPFAYLRDTASWIYFRTIPHTGCLFYDFSSRKWALLPGDA